MWSPGLIDGDRRGRAALVLAVDEDLRVGLARDDAQAAVAAAAAPKMAETLTCWPEGTVTFWRHGGTPSLRTSMTWSPAGTPVMIAGATSLRTPST